ncbi:MAG: FHA domain-containing protein [Thermoflexales bacterium]|nr:FHA domain-containing protein [Thermoflexales bacterium]MCS7324880.1 FHA domain-containing protein [Thermoflexales bacterium]MDW8053694.1 FHA domain-containing protein [Anaerolineae bacterium]MDW8293405.1 FHA domain-containing protein [Anaerolineae bacterium]
MAAVAVLVVKHGQMAGQRWALEGERWTIGRDPSCCAIVLPELEVSRRHAEIRRAEDGSLWVTDLGSRNGTWLNGRPLALAPQPLRPGDELLLAGKVSLIVTTADETASLPRAVMSAPLGLCMDHERRMVWVNGKELRPPLSAQQYHVLHLLVSRQGKVVSRDELLDVMDRRSESPAKVHTMQSLNALIHRLRERLAELDAEHNYIVTVRGHGFRFVNRAEASCGEAG